MLLEFAIHLHHAAQITQCAGEPTAQGPTSDLHELLAQVAAGLIAPETAAYQVVRQVGEDLGTQNGLQQSTADQMIHQLTSTADAEREESTAGEHEDFKIVVDSLAITRLSHRWMFNRLHSMIHGLPTLWTYTS